MTNIVPQIAEIVSFQLADNTNAQEFMALIKTTEDFVHSAPGFVSRQVSTSEDGNWTDLVVWRSIEEAKSAQESFMQQDFAPAVLAAIDPDSFSMTHQEIHWQIT